MSGGRAQGRSRPDEMGIVFHTTTTLLAEKRCKSARIHGLRPISKARVRNQYGFKPVVSIFTTDVHQYKTGLAVLLRECADRRTSTPANGISYELSTKISFVSAV